MKKIILLTILTLSLSLQFGSNGVGISTTQQAIAQQSNCTWKCNQGGFFQWLKTAASNIATAVSNVASEIANFFTGNNDDNEDNGGEEFGDETDESDNWYEPSGSPDDFQMPFDDSWFQPPTWGEDEWDIYHNLDYWYGVYVNGGSTPIKDCNGIWGGSAYVGVCGVCLGGSTGVDACMIDSLRADTVQPIKIICDSAAISHGNKSTTILHALDSSQKMQQLRSTIYGATEAALSAYDSSGTPAVMPNSYNLGDSNSVQMMPFDTTTGPNHKNIIAVVHSHQKGIDPIPDAHDLYQFLYTRVLRFGNPKYNPYITNSFIICGDTTVDLAITIADTAKALQFINMYQYANCVKLDSTGRNPEWANFINTTFGDTTSMSDEFNDAYKLILKNNYPDELAKTYAQVFMIQNYNMGIKTLMKVNGAMKELSPIITRDPVTGKLTDLKINICQ